MKDGAELSEFTKNLDYLDGNMQRVKEELSALYFVECSMDRQLSEMETEFDSSESRSSRPSTPDSLSTFDSATPQPIEEGRFKFVRKLCDASRNKGVVELHRDTWQNKLVAAKRMPTEWLCKSHEEFSRNHPKQTELPWVDIAFTQFLNSVNYKYACGFEGVFCNSEHSYVNFSYAPGGDLFSIALSGVTAGPEREATFRWLVLEIFTGFKQLHDMNIVHRDISLENILLVSDMVSEVNNSPDIRFIDYAMASNERTFCNARRGKPAYQAPEMHVKEQVCDAFLTDAFAIGVVLYTLFLRDYPWLSTKPGSCLHFEYVKRHGFRSFCAKRKVRGTNKRVAESVSEPLMQLLEGLLELDPEKRLSLGEQHSSQRKSVWDLLFTVQCHPKI